MSNKGLLGQLIQSLCILPGVGPKTAQRMAFQLLQRDRSNSKKLAETLFQALEKIGYCPDCRTLTEFAQCSICSDVSREASVLCVVENPADAWIIEQATGFRGRYFILHGRLSPLDGVGPDELGLDNLELRFSGQIINELILATSSTVEGEATTFFISELAKKYNIKVTRIAHGVPMGGELEFIDSGTLSHAFNGRKLI